MSNVRLYHRDVYLPFKVNLPTIISLHLSKHAIEAAANDRYGAIALSGNLSTLGAEIIEVETVISSTGQQLPSKIVFRKQYAEGDVRHVVYVIAIHRGTSGQQSYTLKTCWFNLASDTHGTLDTLRYVQRPNGIRRAA